MYNSYIKTELFDYQKEAVEKALQYKRFIVSLDTGQGKTLVSLSIFDKIKEKDPEVISVVIVTKTGLAVWAREIKKHTTFTFVEGKLSNQYDISILTIMEFIKVYKEFQIFQRNFKVVGIIDETHYLKSPDSRQACLVKKIMLLFRTCIGLTASPLLNHIEDVFYLFEAYFPGIFGSHFERFMDFYTVRRVREVDIKGKNVRFKEVISYKNLDDLKKRISPFIYRRQAEYNIHFHFHPIEINPGEFQTYLKAAKGILTDPDNPRDFVARLPQLQLAANNSVNLDGSLRRGLDMSSKELYLIELVGKVLEKNESVIVFTYFKMSLSRLMLLFNYYFPNRYAVISGGTPTYMRKKISQDFSAGQIILATAAGSQSLNLQAANNVIFFDLPWSVGTFLQAVGRIARVDSLFGVFNVHLLGVKETIDDYKLMLVKSNLTLINEVIGGSKPYSALSIKLSKAYIVKARRHLLWCFKRKSEGEVE